MAVEPISGKISELAAQTIFGMVTKPLASHVRKIRHAAREEVTEVESISNDTFDSQTDIASSRRVQFAALGSAIFNSRYDSVDDGSIRKRFDSFRREYEAIAYDTEYELTALAILTSAAAMRFLPDSYSSTTLSVKEALKQKVQETVDSLIQPGVLAGYDIHGKRAFLHIAINHVNLLAADVRECLLAARVSSSNSENSFEDKIHQKLEEASRTLRMVNKLRQDQELSEKRNTNENEEQWFIKLAARAIISSAELKSLEREFTSTTQQYAISEREVLETLLESVNPNESIDSRMLYAEGLFLISELYDLDESMEALKSINSILDIYQTAPKAAELQETLVRCLDRTLRLKQAAVETYAETSTEVQSEAAETISRIQSIVQNDIYLFLDDREVTAVAYQKLSKISSSVTCDAEDATTPSINNTSELLASAQAKEKASNELFALFLRSTPTTINAYLKTMSETNDTATLATLTNISSTLVESLVLASKTTNLGILTKYLEDNCNLSEFLAYIKSGIDSAIIAKSETSLITILNSLDRRSSDLDTSSFEFRALDQLISKTATKLFHPTTLELFNILKQTNVWSKYALITELTAEDFNSFVSLSNSPKNNQLVLEAVDVLLEQHAVLTSSAKTALMLSANRVVDNVYSQLVNRINSSFESGTVTQNELQMFNGCLDKLSRCGSQYKSSVTELVSDALNDTLNCNAGTSILVHNTLNFLTDNPKYTVEFKNTLIESISKFMDINKLNEQLTNDSASLFDKYKFVLSLNTRHYYDLQTATKVLATQSVSSNSDTNVVRLFNDLLKYTETTKSLLESTRDEFRSKFTEYTLAKTTSDGAFNSYLKSTGIDSGYLNELAMNFEFDQLFETTESKSIQDKFEAEFSASTTKLEEFEAIIMNMHTHAEQATYTGRFAISSKMQSVEELFQDTPASNHALNSESVDFFAPKEQKLNTRGRI